MTNLSPDELAEMRALFSDMDLSEEKQDEFIRIMDNFAMASADRAYGFSSIQISLSTMANYSFDGVDAYAKVRKSRTIERKALKQESAIENPYAKGPGVP